MKLTENIEALNCDCMEYMKDIPDKFFELAIVDPEYGIDAGNMTMGSGNNKKYKKSDWDKKKPDKSYFDELFRISKNQIIWGGNYFINYLENTRCLICWNKMTYIPSMSQMEVAWTSFDRHTKYIKINSNQNDRIHISQKPIQLYEWLLNNYANENDKILDTHLGSGSITIAIDKANTLDKKNLTFVGCEIDSDYFNDAVKRFQNYKQQLTIF